MSVAELLAFEARFPTLTEGKRAAIRTELGITELRYFLTLTRMLADEALLAEAIRIDPTTTHRLLRQRDERAATRKARS